MILPYLFFFCVLQSVFTHGIITEEMLHGGEFDDVDENDGSVSYHLKGEGKELFEKKFLQLINEEAEKNPSHDFDNEILNRVMNKVNKEPFPFATKPARSEKSKEKQQDEVSINPNSDLNAIIDQVTPHRRQLGDLDALNSYWSGTNYGREPGPCPNSNNRCVGLACNLQGYLLDLDVDGLGTLRSLIVENANPCVKNTNNGRLLTGQAEIYNFACQNLYARDIVLRYVSATSNEVIVDFEIYELQLTCQGNLDFHHLGLDYLYADSNGYRNDDGRKLAVVKARNPLDGKLTISVSRRGAGITIKTRTSWKTLNNAPFSENLPYEMNFIEHPDGGNDGDGGCRLPSFNFGLDFVGGGDYVALDTATWGCWFAKWCGFGRSVIYWNNAGASIISFIVSFFKGAILGLVRSIIAGILCSIVKQLAYLNGNVGSRGGINIWILKAYNTITGYRNLGPRGPAKFIEDENAMKSNPSLNLVGAMDFSSSDQFEAVSLGINSVLGGVSDSPSYIGRLTVNELIDIGLKTTTGILDLGDVKTKLELDAYPKTAFTGPVFDGVVELQRLKLWGLNSFTAFNFLVNGFGDNPWPKTPILDYGKPSDRVRYQYTFVNALEMASFGFEATIGLKLCDGSWVTNRSPNNERCMYHSIPLKLDLSGIKGNMAIHSAFITQRFLDLVIGTVVGDIERFVDRVRCLATTIEWFGISGARMSIAQVVSLSLQTYNGPLKLIFSNGVAIFNSVYQGALKNYLPDITDQWVRRKFNDYLKSSILVPAYRKCPLYNACNVYQNGATAGQPYYCARMVGSSMYCYPYADPCPTISNVLTSPTWKTFYSDTDPSRYINFVTSRSWDAIRGAVNGVIGGNPVKKSSGDVNRFVQTYLEYYLPDLAPATIVRKIAYGNWAIDQIDSHTPIDISVNTYTLKLDQLSLNNTHSIHVLTMQDVDFDTFKVNAVVGDGYLYDKTDINNPKYELRGPIGASFRFSAFVNLIPKGSTVAKVMADDIVRVFFGFKNITFATEITAKINQNDFLKLRWKDLTKSTCLLAIVDYKLMHSLALGFKNFDLRLSFEKTPSATALGSALDAFKNEIPTWGENVPKMIQYFFNGIANDIKDNFNNFASINGAVAGCDIRASPFTSSPVLKGIDWIFNYSNFTRYYESISVDAENPRLTMSAYEVEKDVVFTSTYFKITENAIFREVSSSLSGADKAQDLLRSLANFEIEGFFADYDVNSLCGSYSQVCKNAIKIAQALYVEPDGIKVSIDADLNDLGFSDIVSDKYIPGFAFLPGRFTVVNLISIVDFTIFKRYKNEALFTFEHTLLWDASTSLDIDIDFAVQVANEFLGKTPPATKVTQQLKFKINIWGLDVQLMTLTAINAAKFDQLGFFAKLDCFADMFYENGLQLPQIWINAAKVEGPVLTLPNGNAILSKAVTDLISAIAQILLAIVRDDIPDITQGVIAKELNIALSDYLRNVRTSDVVPCEPIPIVPPPDYYNFSSSFVGAALDIFHGVCGGDPVKKGAIGLNTVINRGISYGIEKGLISDSLKENANEHGWHIDTVYELKADDNSNILRITNLVVDGFDTIHVMKITPIDSKTLDIKMKIGGGKLYDPSGTGSYIVNPDLKIDVDGYVKFTDPSPLADENFHLTISMNNFSMIAGPKVFLNTDDLYNLRFIQMRESTRCLLSIVDSMTFESFDLGVYNVNIGITHVHTPSKPTGKLNDALALLASETLGAEDAQDLWYYNNILNVFSEEGMRIFNSIQHLIFDIPLPIAPTKSPTNPTRFPTKNPATSKPTFRPTTKGPTTDPTKPTKKPTNTPTTKAPTVRPTTRTPTRNPTKKPVIINPTVSPTKAPTLSWKTTTCDLAPFPTLGEFLTAADYGMFASDGASSTKELYSKLTSPQPDPKLTPYNIYEGRVLFPPPSFSPPFYITTNKLVQDITKSISSVEFYQKSLRALSRFNFQSFKSAISGIDLKSLVGKAAADAINLTLDVLDSLVLENDNSVSLRIDLAKIAFPVIESNKYGPLLRLSPGKLVVTNLDDVTTFNLLKRYQNSKYIFEHQITFARPLNINIDWAIEVEGDFLQQGAPKSPLVKDQWQMSLTVQGLDIQIMTLTALDSKKFDNLGFFATPDCLFDMFFTGGLLFPQLQISVEDITNLSIGTVEAPKIMSLGFVKLIGAIAEIATTFLAQYFKSATQGYLRDLINTKISDKIAESRLAPVCVPGNRYSIHVSNFTNPGFAGLIDFIEQTIGGDPVVNGTFGMNYLIDFILPKLLKNKLINGQAIQHSGYGSWLVPKLVDLSIDGSHLFVNDFYIRNLNSFHVFTIETIDHRTLRVKIKLGDGKLVDKSVDPYQYIDVDPFKVGATFDILATPPEVIQTNAQANDKFTTELQVSNFSIDAIIETEFSIDDFMTLRFKNFRDDLACVLGIIDQFEIRQLDLGFSDLSFPIWVFLKPASPQDFGNALTTVKNEAVSFSPDNKHFFNNILRIIGEQIMIGANNVEEYIFNTPISTCENTTLPKTSFLLQEAGFGFLGSSSSVVRNISETLKLMTEDQTDARTLPAATIEANVKDQTGIPFKLTQSPIVETLSDGLSDFDSNVFPNTLKSLADFDFVKLKSDLKLSTRGLSKDAERAINLVLDVLDAIYRDVDDSVDFVFPLKNFGFPEINGSAYAEPNTKIIPGHIKVFDIEKVVQFSALAPLTNSKYTLKNLIEWNPATSMKIEIDMILEMPRSMINVNPANPNEIVRDKFLLELQLDHLFLELWTLTAWDAQKFDELGFFASFDCLVDVFYDGGLNLPVIWATLDDIIGPTFSTDNYIMSAGLEALIGAISNIITEIIRNNVPNFSQGYLRTKINDILVSKLEESREAALLKPCFPGNRFNIHFINFTEPFVKEVVSIINNVIGGNDADLISSGAFGINTLVDKSLDFIVKNKKGSTILHPSPGTWIKPKVINFISDTGNKFIIRDFTIDGLNTVNLLSIDVVDSETIDIKIEIGGGQLYNPIDKAIVNNDDLIIKFVTEVVIVEPSKLNTDEIFEMQVAFKDLRIDMDIYMLLNFDDVMTLRFRQWRKPMCALSIVDGLTLKELDLGFVSLTSTITRVHTNSNSNLNLALTKFKQEIDNGMNPDDIHFLNNLMGITGEEISRLFNNVSELFINTNISSCDTTQLPSRQQLFDKIGLGMFGNVKFSNISEWYNAITKDQINVRVALTPISVLEKDIVYIKSQNRQFDATGSTILVNVGKKLSKVSLFQKGLRYIADTNVVSVFNDIDLSRFLREPYLGMALTLGIFLNGLEVQPDDSVDLRVYLGDLGIPYIETAKYGPMFKFAPGYLDITHIENVNLFSILVPYVDGEGKKSQFIFQHTIEYNAFPSMEVDIDLEIEVQEDFVLANGNPNNKVKDIWNFHLELVELSIHLMTLTAVDTIEFEDVGLVTSVPCLLSTFFVHGLSFPEIWIEVKEINNGPTLTTSKTIISDGVAKMFGAFAEIIVAIGHSNLPDATQGYLREQINKSINKAVVDNRNADCEINPFSHEKYLNFTTPLAEKIINVINNVIAGDPVPAGSLGFNNFVDVGLDIIKDTSPVTLIHIDSGTWQIPTIFVLDDREKNGNLINVYNFTIDNLDTIHVFKIDVIDHHTIEISLKVGGGKLWDRQKLEYILNDEILFSVMTEFVIKNPPAEAPRPTMRADDLLKWQLGFTNISIDTNLLIDINMDEVLVLKFSQLRKSHCVLAVVDNIHMYEFELGFADMSFDIFWERQSVGTLFSEAIQQIQSEIEPVISNAPKVMMSWIFDGLSNDVIYVFNNLSHLFINDKLEGCETSLGPVTNDLLAELGLLFFRTKSQSFNYTQIWSGLTTDQANPRTVYLGKEKDLEKSVTIKPAPGFTKTEPFYINKNPIVKEMRSNLDDKQVWTDLIHSIAKFDWNASYSEVEDWDSLVGAASAKKVKTLVNFLESFIIQPDSSVSLVFDLSNIGLPNLKTDRYIPGFELHFNDLVIENVDKATDFQMFVPFGNSDFITSHRLTLGVGAERIKITFSGSLTTDQVFLDRNVGPGIFTDDWSFHIELEELDLQVLLLTAVDATLFSTLPLSQVLKFSDSECFFSTFYDNGFSIPQLWLEPHGLHDVSFTSSSGYNIFSLGFAKLIGAFTDIFGALFEDNLQDATQGLLRDNLNNRLKRKLDDARVRGRGICEPIEPWPGVYLDLKSPSVTKGIDFVQKQVGGDPVTYGRILGINNLVNTFMLSLKSANEWDIDHPKIGEWIFPTVLDFSSNFGNTNIKLVNASIYSLDSIHVFTIEPWASDTLEVVLKIGNGSLIDPDTLEYLSTQPLKLSITLDLFVSVDYKTPGKPTVTKLLANDRIVISFLIANGSFEGLFSSLKINMNEAKKLRITQISSTSCIAAVVDDIFAPTIVLNFTDFDVELDIEKSSDITSFAKAFAQLQTELPVGDVPKGMLKFFLGGISETAKKAVTTFAEGAPLRQITDCEIPRMIFDIVSGISTPQEALKLKLYVRNNLAGVVKATVDVRQEKKTGTWQLHLQHSDAASGKSQAFIRDTLISEVIRISGLSRTDEIPSISVIIAKRGPCANSPLGNTPFEGLCNWVVENNGNITKNIEYWVADRVNPIDVKLPAVEIEGIVNYDPKVDKFYDVQTSKIVSSVSGFFKKHKGRVDGLINDIVNSTEFLEFEDDGSISLVFNVTSLLFWLDENVLKTDGVACDGSFEPSPPFLFEDVLRGGSTFIPAMLIVPGYFRFKNFEKFSDLRLLNPYPGAHFTTEHVLSWIGSSLIMTGDIFIYFDKIFIDPNAETGEEMVEEKLTITMEIKDLLIQILTLLAIDTEYLGRLSLGDFLDVNAAQEFSRRCEAFTCLLTSIYDGGLALPQFTLNVTDIIGPRITSKGTLFSKGVTMLLDAVIEIFVQVFKGDLANIFQGPVRESVDTKLRKMVYEAKLPGACPEKFNYTRDYPQESSRFNFAENAQLKRLKNFIETEMLDPDSVYYINNFMRAIFGNIKTKLREFNGIPIKYAGSQYGTVDVKFGHFMLRGLDEIDWLQIFDPAPYQPGGSEALGNGRLLSTESSHDELEILSDRSLVDREWSYAERKYMTRTAIGIAGLPGDDPLEIGFEFGFKFNGLFAPTPSNPEGVIEDSLRITISIKDFNGLIDLFMLINIPRLMDLQIQSIATIYQLPCIFVIFEPEGLIPAKFNLTFGEVSFLVQCLDKCNSKFLKQLEEGDLDSDSLGKLTQVFTKGWNDVINLIIQYISSTDAQDFLFNQIDISQEACEAIRLNLSLPPTAVEKESNAAFFFGIAGVSILFTAMCGFAALVPIHFQRRNAKMKIELLQAGMAGKMKSKEEFDLVERKLLSPAAHPMVPKKIKILVPLMITSNIIFLAVANFFTVGATVELTLSIAGDKTKPLSLLPFTLASSINDMWNSGSYALAVLIAVASGGWPYIKNMLLAFTWFAPSTILHTERRKSFMEVLDLLGKWSLIDMFVLIMLQVAFRLYLSAQYVQALASVPPDLLVVDVVVTPGFGMYGFLFGTMGGLFVNHIMIYFHRKQVRADEDLQDAIDGVLVKDTRTPRIPLWRHRFAIVDNDGRSYRYSVTSRISVVASLGISFLLLLIGSVVDLMIFKFEGIAGLAIAFIDPSQSRQSYSLITIGTSIMDGAPENGGAKMGIAIIQILYLIFAFFVPLMLLAALGALWVAPLTLREQLKLYFVAEILYCWDSVLVFILSVVACIFQISQLAQFIVLNASGTFCSAITAPLNFLFPNGGNNNKCFDVKSDLAPTSYILFAAGFIALISMACAFRLAFAAIDDREHAMRRKVPKMPGDMTGLAGFLVRKSLEAFGTPNLAGNNGMMVSASGSMSSPSLTSNQNIGYNTASLGSFPDGNAQSGAYLSSSIGIPQYMQKDSFSSNAQSGGNSNMIPSMGNTIPRAGPPPPPVQARPGPPQIAPRGNTMSQNIDV